MTETGRGGIFLSRDEMSPDERLAFDLGHAAATAQSKERKSALFAVVEAAQNLVDRIEPGDWTELREALAALHSQASDEGKA